MDQNRLERIIDELELTEAYTKPKILNQPSSPTISSITLDKKPNLLTIKVIEQRITNKYVGEAEDSEGYFVKRYQRIQERAVNTARLHESGLLELQISSRSNSTKYHLDVNRLWSHIKQILLIDCFSELSLTNAKNYLWEHRETLGETIRFSDSTFRNKNGTILKAATGSDTQDLYSDDGAVSSVNAFIDHDAYCDSSNLWLKQGENIPTSDIHILLSGESNEFAITANCNQQDYEYILRTLQKFNE